LFLSAFICGLKKQTVGVRASPQPTNYRAAHNIDMLVMGAYGHSVIRRFLFLYFFVDVNTFYFYWARSCSTGMGKGIAVPSFFSAD